MRLSLTAASLLLFVLSLVLLAAFSLADPAFVGMSPALERIIAFLMLVVPAVVGAVLGAMGLRRGSGRAWLAITGIILNTLFALFHLMIVLFAG